MNTDYDPIARQYQASKLQPWRTHIERHTLLELVGPVEGLRTIDLACGEGYYTRLLRRLGAGPILGIDLSERMIELAREQERNEPLSIDYQVGDARALDAEGSLDLLFAAYLLNYSSSREDLRLMCEAIARSLKPGGRFVTVNNRPEDPPSNFQCGLVYGYSKRLEGIFMEGASIVWQFHLPSGLIEVTNYLIPTSALESALAAAGMEELQWHPPKVSREGRERRGDAYWKPFLDEPPVAFLSCRKGR
jgi:ubiquinone/menaquinone biosynthesis C-methylase UbiE